VLMFMFAGLKEPTQEEDDAKAPVQNMHKGKKGVRK